MNRSLLLPLLLTALALPLRAQDDDGGAPEPPSAPASGNDGHINIIPLGKNNRNGNSSNGGGGAAGAEGPTDPSIMYLKSYRVKKVFEHHADWDWKQGSYGVFQIDGPKEAVAAAFITRPNGGQMGGNGHYCDVVKASTCASGCGWVVWIAETPGGRPLCATLPSGDTAGPPGAWVLAGDVTAAKLNPLLKANKVSKVGRDTCLLKPSKKYYCHLSALGWDGDNWSPNAQPGMMGQKCIGLRPSSAYDMQWQIDQHKDDPTGL